jgi:hypothetical protein
MKIVLLVLVLSLFSHFSYAAKENCQVALQKIEFLNLLDRVYKMADEIHESRKDKDYYISYFIGHELSDLTPYISPDEIPAFFRSQQDETTSSAYWTTRFAFIKSHIKQMGLLSKGYEQLLKDLKAFLVSNDFTAQKLTRDQIRRLSKNSYKHAFEKSQIARESIVSTKEIDGKRTDLIGNSGQHFNVSTKLLNAMMQKAKGFSSYASLDVVFGVHDKEPLLFVIGTGNTELKESEANKDNLTKTEIRDVQTGKFFDETKWAVFNSNGKRMDNKSYFSFALEPWTPTEEWWHPDPGSMSAFSNNGKEPNYRWHFPEQGYSYTYEYPGVRMRRYLRPLPSGETMVIDDAN